MAGTVLSLLWTKPADRHVLRSAQKQHPTDLNLTPLIRCLSVSNRYANSVEAILQHPVMEAADLNYRLDVIADLLESPALVAALTETLTIIESLEGYMVQPQWEQSELRKVAWRLSELEHYIICIDHMSQHLRDAPLRSQALCALRELVESTAQETLFQELKAELPAMIDAIRGIRSITIGINLDSELRPEEAVLLSVRNERFIDDWPPFFRRLLGAESENNQGPMHRAEKRGKSAGVRLRPSDMPQLQPLFADLADIMDQTCQPIAQALRRYINISGRQLVGLLDELAFFLGAVRLIQHLQDCGLPVCRPVVRPADERLCQIDAIYNLNLALRLASLHKAQDLRQEMVTNDVRFDDEGRIFILTGPNRGGKTTYTQAIGLAQVMMQAGLYIPARQATMSPVDAIFTHFAVEERPDQEAGRLGEEAQRLSAIFDQATRHSLLLFNESLASTSANESFYLARDVVRVVRLLGARAIYATHLHELAADADSINADTEGDSKVISLVSMVSVEQVGDGEEVRRTYKIVSSPPMGHSYAREIALRYGISFEQLKSQLSARQQIPNGVQVNSEDRQ